MFFLYKRLVVIMVYNVIDDICVKGFGNLMIYRIEVKLE